MVNRVVEALKEPFVLKCAAVLSLVAGWQIIGMNTNPIFLSTPVDVAKAFVGLLFNGTLLSALSQTSLEFFLGFIAAIALAIPLGVLAGHYESLFNFIDPIVYIFFAMPVIALLPLFIIWFGLGLAVKIVIVLLSAFFPILINTEAGVREVDRTLIEVAAAHGANERELLTKFLLPASVPYIVAGIRIGTARAVIGVVVAELFASTSGLGALLQFYGNFYQTDKFFVPVIVLAAMSLVLIWIINIVEHKLARWRAIS